MRGMDQWFCVIQHERLSFLNLAVYVVEGIILHGIRAVWTIVVSLAVVVVVAVGETVGLVNITTFLVEFHLSKERLVETELRNHLARASHLPFAYDCRRVSCLLGHVSKCSLIVIHISETHVVLIIVHSGHHLHAARTAQRQRVHIRI